MAGENRNDIAASLEIGPTDQGMVRIHVTTDDGIEIPMDFYPDEALEIAEELQAAAEVARALGVRPRPPKR